MEKQAFRLTYATMFDPPEELHTAFDQALSLVKSTLGKEYGMFVNGRERFAQERFDSCCPSNPGLVLGVFQKGSESDALAAVDAAKAAFEPWRSTPWDSRVSLARKAADLIDERAFTMSAAVSLEVGKNRLEALGDVAEAADLIRYACDQMEKHDGFVTRMGTDPLKGYTVRNVSRLQPYGVWAVISPFNFPVALTAGPAGAALVSGNTVVIKSASDTPWSVRLLVDCFRDAGFPEGVVNYVTGPGETVGAAITANADVAGITFTGSSDVGTEILRHFQGGRFPRPAVLEMGGKNPVIVSAAANLDRAAIGIMRSAFGLQGQKCSASSRLYVHAAVYEELMERLVALTENLAIGDPTRQDIWMGPVINAKAYGDFQTYADDLNGHGTCLTGGKVLQDEALRKGFFCLPSVFADVPKSHRLWSKEMFLPILLTQKVSSLEEAMALANTSNYGLTAGFYGSEDETQWFFDHIQAGVTYANRPQGATTGAWPGFQPFGGWKSSGSTGKNAGGLYYLPMYMREQVTTLVQ